MAPAPQLVTDPVCGMHIDPATAAGHSDYRGTRYYFCNPSCRDALRGGSGAIPPRRPRPAPRRPCRSCIRRIRPAAHPKATAYVCPMDPEVRQDHPGACPKCGMALEPDLSTAPPTRVEYTCPMHPEIVRDAPGACPICGMALEPRTVTLDEATEPRARRHDAAVLDRARCSACRCSCWRWATWCSGMGLGGRVDMRGDQLDRPGVRDAGRALGRLAVLRARLGVDRQPHANMFTLIALGVGAAYLFSVAATRCAAASSRRASGCTAWSRPTSTPRS